MRLTLGPIAVAATLALTTTGVAATTTFLEDFSALPVGTCYPDGQTVGAWEFVYNGYGCNGVTSLGGNNVLYQRPMASVQPDETHANMVTGPLVDGDFTMEVSLATSRPLRTGTPPNPWEVAWLIWHQTDDVHFYYFVPKPNGWELGKADPAYPGAQRFLATGSTPQFPIGPWYRVKVTQVGTTLRVYVNNLLITTFTDNEYPYTSGKIGLYNEDAEVYFDEVKISAAETQTAIALPSAPTRGKKRR